MSDILDSFIPDFESDPLVRQLRSRSMMCRKMANHHRLISDEYQREYLLISNEIADLYRLQKERRAAIQKRWDRRKELRTIKNKLQEIKRTGTAKKSEHKHVTLLKKKADELERRIFQMSSTIDRRAFGPGVYFLISSKRVVYIGQSKNILGRIGQHTDKVFDKACFVPCLESELFDVERAFINALLPELNADPGTLKQKRDAAASFELASAVDV